MRLVNSLVLFAWLVLPLNVLAAPLITEQSVLDMIERIEQATDARDIDGVIAVLSSDVSIVIDMPSNMGGRIEVDLAGYKNMLVQAWGMPADLTHEIQDVEISIAPDGESATVTHLTIETLEANGTVILSSNTKSMFTAKIINGTLKITSLYGEVEIKNPQQASL